MKRAFVYKDEKSNKFWLINFDGNEFAVNYGKNGTNGKYQVKEFDSEEECQKQAINLINQKIKKGYKEVSVAEIQNILLKEKATPMAILENVKVANVENKVIMDENEFWNIISMFDWKYTVNDDKVLKRAINYLAKKANEDIYKFYDILSKLLYELDGIEYAKNIGEDSYIDEDSPFSVDCFLYARCVVVANGSDYYYEVLNNPEEMPKDMEFETLLYVAPEAYEKKNTDEFDYLPEYDFETFSNKEKWL